MTRVFTTLIIILGLAAAGMAEVELPRIMASHMILQQGKTAPIWGWSASNEAVTVEFAGQSKSTVADDGGRWMVWLDPLKASGESRVLTIRGENELRLEDVLVGEVWLASGQSNMEWALDRLREDNQAYAAAHKDNPYVRCFHVNPRLQAGYKLDDVLGSWKSAAELQQAPGASGLGFFFALKLHQELEVPVAYIDATWMAMAIGGFIPPEGYRATGLELPGSFGYRNAERLAKHLRQVEESVTYARGQAEKGRFVPTLFLDRPHGGGGSFIYFGMMSGLVPYGIKGAIWYQGEANRKTESDVYFSRLQALSAGWSEVFKVERLPILQVQIAPFLYDKEKPRDTTLCDNIWRAQYRGAEEIEGMGIVPVHDTDIPIDDIHPPNKRPVGDRLVALALRDVYGRDVVATGPRVAGATREGDSIVVSFKDIDQGLSTKDGEAPSWFELSADGETFVDATAEICGDQVVVRAAGMVAPTHVRMGWAETAIPNLQDKNGWPVFAFPGQSVK